LSYMNCHLVILLKEAGKLYVIGKERKDDII
jgi:hypothetical protein